MAVVMESDGYLHVLRIEDNDVKEFIRKDRGWEISFKSVVYTTNVISIAEVDRNYVHRDDIDNKSKYWKTEELVQQLQGLRDHYARMRDHWKSQEPGLSLALKYSMKAAAIKEILDTLENENYIWEE
jgi:hypothetical protein